LDFCLRGNDGWGWCFWFWEIILVLGGTRSAFASRLTIFGGSVSGGLAPRDCNPLALFWVGGLLWLGVLVYWQADGEVGASVFFCVYFELSLVCVNDSAGGWEAEPRSTFFG